MIAVLQKMKERRAAKIRVLENLCAEFVSCNDDKRRRILQIQISALDRRLQLEDRPDVFYNVVVDYYRTRMDSVAVAEKNGMTPWGVRQILFRMNKVAKALGYDVMVTCSRIRRSAEQVKAEHDRKRELRQAEREARRAEREARKNAPRLCPCGQPSVDRLHRYCAPCKAKKAAEPSIHERRRAAGLCWHCGEQPPAGFKTCAVVRAYRKPS